MALGKTAKWLLIGAAGLSLAACEEGLQFNPFKPQAQAAAESGARGATVIEEDVEAPEVFQVSEAGLWDGRPSLGGVWVAHPTVGEPERVLIKNDATGETVIGALFRREIESAGPKLQVSSDAANALSLLAGQPANLTVVALRRKEVVVEPEITDAPTGEFAEAETIDEAPLDPIASAAAAIDEAEAGEVGAPQSDVIASADATEPAPIPVETASTLPLSPVEKPYVQLGIFSIESNATGTAQRMRDAGIVPTVLKQESKGKVFWRVIAGPVASKDEKAALLEKVRGLGFSDAYFVTN